ncbi:CagC family type IV secretion system protein [Bacillus pumilus]|uniref:CagC family type IV secretion system protein n=1 Tax=Bacillus pumilus TaxID=1408 RepID=UPI0011A6B752|nr:CagC family type IV secretion system protein [Bacillus pumilus]
MQFIKKHWMLLLMFAAVLVVSACIPEVGQAAASTAQVKTKLNKAVVAVGSVLTALVVAVGVAAGIKVVLKHLPGYDDPHQRNEMWKSLGGVLIGVGAGAAISWLVPWGFSLLV